MHPNQRTRTCALATGRLAAVPSLEPPESQVALDRPAQGKMERRSPTSHIPGGSASATGVYVHYCTGTDQIV